uniref:ABC transporter domain-containing protein n=1 Tax=Strigamia maritima TaxID=126957 RepID=T1ITJ3_STRMM
MSDTGAEKDALAGVVVKDLYYNYGFSSWAYPVLKGIDLNVAAGTIYGLLGPSGCGKTTLLKCVIGTLKPDSGRVRLFGRLPGTVKSRVPGVGVGYMPQ